MKSKSSTRDYKHSLESPHDRQSEIEMNLLRSRLNSESKIINSALQSHKVSMNISNLFDETFPFTEYMTYAEPKCKNTSTPTKEEESDYKVALQAAIAKFSASTLNIFAKSTLSEYAQLIHDAIDYGKAFCALSILLNDGNIKMITEEIVSRKAKKNISKGWENPRATCADLVAQAEEMWTRGSTLLHNEMADHLLKFCSPDIKIPRNTLLRELRPAARSFGKVRGEKGVKKTPTS